MRTPADVVLKAYDLLEQAMSAEDAAAAVAAVRADLEVLPPEDLLRVAVALAVEPVRRLVPADTRARVLDRLQRARLGVMWEGS